MGVKYIVVVSHHCDCGQYSCFETCAKESYGIFYSEERAQKYIDKNLRGDKYRDYDVQILRFRKVDPGFVRRRVRRRRLMVFRRPGEEILRDELGRPVPIMRLDDSESDDSDSDDDNIADDDGRMI